MVIKDKYKWIMDSRESNPVFIGTVKGNSNIWEVKALRMSRFICLPPGTHDYDVADMTNENADGLVEFKSWADLIGSLTGENSYHLEEQVIKMYATGIPSLIVVYGSRFAFQNESNVTSELILQGLRKLVVLQGVYRVPAIFVDSEEEAIEIAKSFIRHCNELPRRMPVYNLLKYQGPVAVLVGFFKIGEKTAKLILKKWKRLKDFFDFLGEKSKNNETKEFIAEQLHKKTPSLRKDQSLSIATTYLEYYATT